MEGDQNQKWAAGPHKSKTAQRSKCQVRKASKTLTTDQPARPLQHPATKATTKNGLQALKKATQRKEASGNSISQIQASSDGNTHKSKHKLRGGGREKQPEQKQGIKECLNREYTALYAKCLPDLSLRSLRKNSSSTAEAENWWCTKNTGVEVTNHQIFWFLARILNIELHKVNLQFIYSSLRSATQALPLFSEQILL